MAGPRQVGKTTLVRQVVSDVDRPVRFVSADEPTLRGRGWIAEQWELARLASRGEPGVPAIEVKSGASGGSPAGRDAFQAQFEPDRVLVVGGDGIPLESFLADAVGRWVA